MLNLNNIFVLRILIILMILQHTVNIKLLTRILYILLNNYSFKPYIHIHIHYFTAELEISTSKRLEN